MLAVLLLSALASQAAAGTAAVLTGPDAGRHREFAASAAVMEEVLSIWTSGSVSQSAPRVLPDALIAAEKARSSPAQRPEVVLLVSVAGIGLDAPAAQDAAAQAAVVVHLTDTPASVSRVAVGGSALSVGELAAAFWPQAAYQAEADTLAVGSVVFERASELTLLRELGAAAGAVRSIGGRSGVVALQFDGLAELQQHQQRDGPTGAERVQAGTELVLAWYSQAASTLAAGAERVLPVLVLQGTAQGAQANSVSAAGRTPSAKAAKKHSELFPAPPPEEEVLSWQIQFWSGVLVFVLVLGGVYTMGTIDFSNDTMLSRHSMPRAKLD
eukprot:TRINITY_DN1135_c0_g1_i1.p1 TRINITY_DN1135_c0_g1~~TRINITY_DN1135_c0_g1_i1.p1  ORF type:complete len:340 (-),score=101.33 TRINITY_DN1135_c0_g1_i1:31-1011(-)